MAARNVQPLSRAVETAEIIASELGLERPVTHPGLIERDYGVAEGTSVVDFHARFDDDTPILNAETSGELTDRILMTLTELVAEQPELPTVVVAHGGVLRELPAHASAGSLPRPGERIMNGSVTLFRMADARIMLAAGNSLRVRVS